MSAYGQNLAVNRVASGAIDSYRIVRGTTTDGLVAQSAAGTEKHVGVSGAAGAANGERIDIIHHGIVPVRLGGAVAFGDQVTSDDEGRAVVAKPGERVVGVALENGTEDDIVTVMVAPQAAAPSVESFVGVLTAGANTALTNASAYGFYTRVGDFVFGVLYAIDIAHTAGAPTASVIEFAPPVASNFAAASDAGGTVTGEACINGRLQANAADNRLVASYSANATGDRDVVAQFAYRVI